MTEEAEASLFVMADTNVVVHLSKASPLSRGYEDLRHGRRIAISFQVRAELGGYPQSKGWGSRRQEALGLLLASCVEIPHSPAANTWYARVNEKRRELRNNSGEGDVWIVAQALEHSAPLMCHDRDAVALAQSMGVEVLSLLEDDSTR